MTTELDMILDELTVLRMDQYEIKFWREVMPTLPPEEKEELVTNLKAQLEILKKAEELKKAKEEAAKELQAEDEAEE